MEGEDLFVDAHACTRTGTSHGETNQDDYLFEIGELPRLGPVCVAAVFDGHSPGGEYASQHAVHALRASFRAATQGTGEGELADGWQELESRPDVLMKVLFKHLHDKVVAGYEQMSDAYNYIQGGTTLSYIKKKHDKWGYVLSNGHAEIPLDYGCTASIVIIYFHRGVRHMALGHCGDSPVTVARCHLETTADGLDLQTLIRNHTLLAQPERERITEFVQGRAEITPDFYLLVTEEQALSQHQVRVSRSLGHKQLVKYGVSWEPDFYMRRLESTDCFALAVMSDGVTDSLRKSMVLDVLAHTTSAQEAAEQLCEEAYNLSLSTTSRSDDCTAIVVCF